MLINTYDMPIELDTFSMKINVCRSDVKQPFHYLLKFISTTFEKHQALIEFLLFRVFFIQILVRHRVTYVNSYCSNPPTNTLDCINGCTGSVVTNANCTESNLAENQADIEGETIFDIRNSTSSPLGLRLVNYSHACFVL